MQKEKPKKSGVSFVHIFHYEFYYFISYFFYILGLTYHDAIKESGVYNKAISRLPVEAQVARQVCNI